MIKAVHWDIQFIESISDSVTEKYRQLVKVFADFQDRSILEIVDSLLPVGNAECSVLREVGLFSANESEDVKTLFDRVKTHVTQPEMPEAGDYVRVMSLHKSKGLTSRVCIVAGCIQGLIPFQDTSSARGEQVAVLAEQRRLFYVALTRCTEMLVLSSTVSLDRQLAWKIGAQLGSGAGRIGRTIASPFIDQLGPSAPNAVSGQRWQTANYIS